MGNVNKSATKQEDAWKRFSRKEIHTLERGFERLAKASPQGGMNAIDFNTFRALLLADFPDFPETLAGRLFTVLDTNKSQSLDFNELLCGLCTLSRGMFEERLRLLFSIYDKYNSNSLDRKILESFANALDDDRSSLEEKFSSMALIEEIFKCTGSTTSGSVDSAVLATPEITRLVSRYMGAPIISWTVNVGQRLLEPLFLAHPSPLIAPPPRIERPSVSIHIEDNSPISPPTPPPPENIINSKFNSESSIQKESQKVLSRRVSSRSQIKEGAEFRLRHKAPTREAFVPGEEWFVVSANWFERWKSYSGCFMGEDIVKLERSDRPGPIDNRLLLRSRSLMSQDLNIFEEEQEDALAVGEKRFYSLRPDIHFGHDFVLLCESAWEYLSSLYGGGPHLGRQVIQIDSDPPELELYPVVLNVRCVALSSEDEGDIGYWLQANRPATSSIASESSSVSSDLDSEESQQIVVSRQITMKELRKRILVACIGETMVKSRLRSDSNASSNTESSALTDSSLWQGECCSQDRMRLWCVVGDGNPADESELSEEDSPNPANGKERFALRSSSPIRSVPVPSTFSVQLLSRLNQTVEDANLEDGQTIVLELGTVDGCWPLANVTTLKSLQPKETAPSLAIDTAAEFDSKKRVLLLGGGRSPMRKRLPGPSATTEALAASRRLAHSSSSRSLTTLATRNPADYTFSSDSTPPVSPSALRRRNDAAAAASSPVRVKCNTTVPGNIGLQNLGNTCFMNAALQCLMHTEHLKQYFLDGSYVLDVNTTSKLTSHGRLADAFADLVRSMWTCESAQRHAFLAPRRFKKEIAHWDSRFSGFEQQDASELLSSLLDGLSEDLNRIKRKAYVELKDSDGRADDVVAREWWENHLLRELSIITALFTGQFKSLLECGACKYQSARFEPYMYLSLPLPDSPLRTVIINLVFCDNSRPPLVCSVRVAKDGTFGDVKDALLALRPGETGETTNTGNKIEQRAKIKLESNRLVLAFVYERQIQAIIQDDRLIETLRERDPLFAFQLPDIESTYATKLASHEAPTHDDDGQVLGDSPDEEAQPPALPLRVGTAVIYKAGNSDTLNAVVVGEKGEGKIDIRFATQSTSLPNEVKRQFRTIAVKRESVEIIAHEPLLLKVEQRQWHHHTCYFLNPYRVTSVGRPFLLLFHPDRVTGAALYEIVAKQVGLRFNPDELSGKDNLTDDETIRAVYGFKLTRVSRPGGTCGHCPWYKSCTGCPILPDDELLSLHQFDSGNAIAVDWGLATSMRDQNFGLSMAVADTHSSVEAARKEECKEMPLSSLIENFSKVEELCDMDQVYCSKCKTQRDHTKNIQLWRAPPVLVIHLKRFQHSTWRRKKLVNLVNFPMFDLDLKPYLAESMGATSEKGAEFKEDPNEPEEEGRERSTKRQSSSSTTKKAPLEKDQQEKLLEEQKHIVEELMDSDFKGLKSYGGHTHGGIPALYDLYGVVNHSGNLGAGHYVSTVKNCVDDNWYLYDDKQVSKIDESKVVTPNAYLLFYVRKDVQSCSVGDIFPGKKVESRELKQRLKELNQLPSSVNVGDRCSVM